MRVVEERVDLRAYLRVRVVLQLDRVCGALRRAQAAPLAKRRLDARNAHDPADTGRLWAVIGPLAGLLRNFKTVDAYIEPEFMEPLLEIETHGRFRLVPIEFIYLLVRFLLSLAILANGHRWHFKES